MDGIFPTFIFADCIKQSNKSMKQKKPQPITKSCKRQMLKMYMTIFTLHFDSALQRPLYHNVPKSKNPWMCQKPISKISAEIILIEEGGASPQKLTIQVYMIYVLWFQNRLWKWTISQEQAELFYLAHGSTIQSSFSVYLLHSLERHNWVLFLLVPNPLSFPG